jgi:hypothetical protein
MRVVAACHSEIEKGDALESELHGLFYVVSGTLASIFAYLQQVVDGNEGEVSHSRFQY